jgi:arginine/ornithine transport system substrate-binding protein
MRNILLIVFLIAGLKIEAFSQQSGGLPPPSSAIRKNTPSPAKQLLVAVAPDYEPFTFKTADGQLTGFDVDIANALCQNIKIKCVFVEQEWGRMIPGLNAKKYDVIISSMWITDARLREIDFTDKYYNVPSSIVLKKGSKFTDVSSIKGKKIGVLKGSMQENYANGELRPAGVIVNSYDAQDQVYRDIKSGLLDGTVADFLEVTAGFLRRPEGSDYELVGPDLKDNKYFGYGVGIGLRKENQALKDKLNAGIKSIYDDNTYKSISEKYFSKFNIDIFNGRSITTNLTDSRLTYARSLKYSERINYLRSTFASNDAYVSAVIGAPYYSHSQTNTQESQLLESSQTWWHNDKDGIIVFQNLTNKSLTGIVLRIDDGPCNTGSSYQYRRLMFTNAMRVRDISAFKFEWPNDLQKKSRCIDIVGTV